MPWLDSIWKALNERFPDLRCLDPDPSRLDECKYKSLRVLRKNHVLEACDSIKFDHVVSKLQETKIPSQSWPFPVFYSNEMHNLSLTKILFNKRMTAESHFQDVRHLSFELNVHDFECGDILLVQPCNPLDVCTIFMQNYFGIFPDDLIEIDSNNNLPVFPSPILALDLFSKHLAICSLPVPTRYFFEQLSYFATVPREKQKLMELSLPSGTEQLQKYCIKEKRSVLVILAEFPSVQIPLAYFLQLVPRIQPRPFSIASYSTSVVDLCVAVVDYTTPMKRKRLGLCSHYLSLVQENGFCFMLKIFSCRFSCCCSYAWKI